MVDLLTAVAPLLVALATASYLYSFPAAGRNRRLGDALFLLGVALVLFADEATAGTLLDVAVAVGVVLLVGGLSVKILRPFSPSR